MTEADVTTLCSVNEAETGIPPGWVAGEQLGVSSRHVRRIFRELKATGKARKIGGAHCFHPSHPTVSALLVKVNTDRSYEDLDRYTQRQIETARQWVKIIRTGHQEIGRKMATSRLGRTQAVEWFCKVRCPALGLGDVSVRTFYARSRAYDQAGQFKLISQIDTRGRNSADSVSCSPEAWVYFCGFYLDPRRRSVRLCYELTADEADSRGWKWPSCRTIERRVREEIPEPTLVLAREGEKAFKSKCVRRIRRSYENVAAGSIWCADENTMDLYARAPDGKGGWKRVRPLLTAWLDVRSRYFLGWHIGARANSDTILSAFKMGVREFGPPLEVHCDNGSDYNAAANVTKRTKRSKADQDRVAGVYSELDIAVHWATPYEPQAKIIESHFRPVCSRFCKLFDSYCGNKPEHRPEGATTIPVWKLPTVDEVAEQFAAWLKAHHAKPQTGDGMFNLSPYQAMEQFRGSTVRERPTEEFLDFLCAKIVGPVKVSKDGVRYQGIHYGQGCDLLLRRQGTEVLLRVHPDRADFVDVCDMEGRPLVRAENNRLIGANQDDIRTALSDRKRARRIAKQYVNVVPALVRHSEVSATIQAMRRRNQSEQENTEPPEPPKTIKAVRPDIREDVKVMVAEGGSKANRRSIKRQSERFDICAVNAALGLGGNLEELVESPGSGEGMSTGYTENADALLTTGRMDAGSVKENATDGVDGTTPEDAFEALGRSIHEQRNRKRA